MLNDYNHKKLKVWQKSMNLAHEIYNVTYTFPEYEKFSLTSQLRRCAVSIPSNIAEGYGRGSQKEILRFLSIARGSLVELDTQLEISLKLDYFNKIKFEDLNKTIDEISRMITGLRVYLTNDK